MFVTVLFYIFTVINLIAVKDVYWPLMKDHVDAFMALHTVTKNWQLAVLYITVFIKTLIKAVYREKAIKLKQWWHKTTISLGNDRFLLVHYINDEQVRIIVKKREDEIRGVFVFDDDDVECYTDEAKPFLMYQQEELVPETLGLAKTLTIYTESGEVLRREVKK